MKHKRDKYRREKPLQPGERGDRSDKVNSDARPLLTPEQLAAYAGVDEPQFYGDIARDISSQEKT